MTHEESMSKNMPESPIRLHLICNAFLLAFFFFLNLISLMCLIFCISYASSPGKEDFLLPLLDTYHIRISF